MDFDALTKLRVSHPAWRLLAATNAPLVVSFLERAFLRENVRTVSRSELGSKLEDHLFHLRQQLGEDAFPRTAAQYLEDWAADDCGWLRKYYRADSDEPHFDLSAAAEKAIDWLLSLQQRQLVATESRLMMVFALLRELVERTETDPKTRLAELQKKRAALDAEITRLQQGHLELMEPAQVKDRFLQAVATARGLLSDFREVEQNFRQLDRAVRERIATWEGSKGELLETVFGERDAIADSDQGKSFRAFWDFLMSPARQGELSALLEGVLALPAVRELSPDPRLKRIHYDWLEAGDVAQRTVARLSEQLRRYLDDVAWLEDRRIMQLIHEVEQSALALREAPPKEAVMYVDDLAPDIALPMERPLFSPPFSPRITGSILLDGGVEVDVDALYEQLYVDKARLSANIRRALQARDQITLADLLVLHPLEQGLAELVAYLSLAADNKHAVIDDVGRQTVMWDDKNGTYRNASLPLVVFSR